MHNFLRVGRASFLKSSAAGLSLALAVFFCPSSVAVQLENDAEVSSSTACLNEYAKLQEAYHNINGKITVVSSDGSGLAPYLLVHARRGNDTYSFWEHLNGEIRGYALRNGQGFDFNQVRQAVDELNWHPTLIWDRLLDKRTSFKDYVCVFTGRARLAGHKVSLLRLAPQDGLRYGYLIAKDDDTSLPVEISVLEPQGGIVAKLLALQIQHVDEMQFPVQEELFSRFVSATQSGDSVDKQAVWPILTIPKPFELIASGKMPGTGAVPDFLEFSDGLSSFRVYRAAKTSVLYPALNNGTITVLRKPAADFEYAVVGEVPLRLAELVLSKIPPAR